MRAVTRAALAALILAGFAGGLPSSKAEARLADSAAVTGSRASREGPCAIRWRRAYYIEHRTGPVRRLIECAVDLWPVSGGTTRAIAIFSCESGLRPDAYNGSGCAGYGCGGVSQQHLRYWKTRAHNLLGSWDVSHGWASARANVIVAVRMAHADGWGGWGCA